jgi:threonylcarbamoyladenosine tRNA methylthiotransferase MtaB
MKERLSCMAKGFYVHNLGCKVNRVESDSIASALIAQGAQRVARNGAEVVIINTCTVTAEADTKTRKAVRQACALPAKPWVVVTGCATVLHAEELAALGVRVVLEPDRVLALKRAHALLEASGGASSRSTDASLTPDTPATPATPGTQDARNAQDMQDTHKGATGTRIGPGFATRVGVKIQDGCNNRCSFCIVSTVRGPSRSYAATDIYAEIRCLAQAGAREIVITGINLGSYYDKAGKSNLATLLARCLEVAPALRIRISSIEPMDVSSELLELMAASQGRICAHLHLPLQSGSDRILERMKRPYTRSAYEQVIQAAKQAMPHIALSTDVIVGFPGETEEDFQESLTCCEHIGFSRLHVFRYSKRTGTAAALMSEQLAAPLKAARSAQMRALAERLATQDAARRVGSTEQVVVERAQMGTSESYHSVTLPRGCSVGAVLSCTFTAHDGAVLCADEHAIAAL